MRTTHRTPRCRTAVAVAPGWTPPSGKVWRRKWTAAAVVLSMLALLAALAT